MSELNPRCLYTLCLSNYSLSESSCRLFSNSLLKTMIGTAFSSCRENRNDMAHPLQRSGTLPSSLTKDESADHERSTQHAARSTEQVIFVQYISVGTVRTILHERTAGDSYMYQSTDISNLSGLTVNYGQRGLSRISPTAIIDHRSGS